jgi:methionine-rich copper-binding protein CopC
MMFLVRTALIAVTVVATGVTAVAATPRAVGATAARPIFHLRLQKSEPASGDTVTSPRVVRLWFSMLPQLSVTSVRLTGPGGNVPLGRPTFAGDVAAPVEATVGQPLARGTYTVSWKTASRDMHPVTGEFRFTVR